MSSLHHLHNHHHHHHAHHENDHHHRHGEKHCQSTILTPISDHACFVTIELKDELKSSSNGKAMEIYFKLVEACLQIMERWNKEKCTQFAVGFGYELTNSILGNIQDNSLDYVREYMKEEIFPQYPKDLKGKFGGFPNTGGDLFLHIKSVNMDNCFRATQDFANHEFISPLIKKIQDETYAFLHRRNKKSGLGRDLSGFEDGTENPKEMEEKIEATLTNEKDSFLLAQKWVHNLKFFNSLSLKEQENDIGRTKEDSIELEDKPETSHVARVTLEKDGEEIEVVRQSMSFGNSSQHGLFFISYANSGKTFIHQLESMVGKGEYATPQGHNDHIMRFSTNILGSLYFIPSIGTLLKMREKLTSYRPSRL